MGLDNSLLYEFYPQKTNEPKAVFKEDKGHGEQENGQTKRDSVVGRGGFGEGA